MKSTIREQAKYKTRLLQRPKNDCSPYNISKELLKDAHATTFLVLLQVLNDNLASNHVDHREHKRQQKWVLEIHTSKSRLVQKGDVFQNVSIF